MSNLMPIEQVQAIAEFCQYVDTPPVFVPSLVTSTL